MTTDSNCWPSVVPKTHLADWGRGVVLARGENEHAGGSGQEDLPVVSFCRRAVVGEVRAVREFELELDRIDSVQRHGFAHDPLAAMRLDVAGRGGDRRFDR